ncbi:MAG: diphosphate--fructose-6-phosphate 1-phosphotransferase [Bryobacteraceae bacterium]|nr:diphosphate--fructose-6-phosphate 1-phosphotransferase [Bryobacteraceae bacterium]
MSDLRGTALIAHGGGPTAVINASLAGAIEQCRREPQITNLLGARFGVRGLLSDDLIDLNALDEDTVDALRITPGSALGSSRLEIRDEGFEQLFRLFERHNVRFFFYTGGNGSMETAMQIHRLAVERGYELSVIGIPKTIDNDLSVTDHSPGHASCARFFAHAVRDIGEDNRSLPSPVCVVESLGRNAGWVAASTALARHYEDDAPHLIYFPERPVNEDTLMAQVEAVYRRLGRVVLVACEGQMNDRGEPFGADVDRADSPVHRLPSNLGHSLARLISARTGLRARAEKPGLLGRSCALLVSEVDRAEAFVCGRSAVRAAVQGNSGYMVAIRRDSDHPYRSSTFLVPLEQVARRERLFPQEWITADGCDVKPAYLDYIRPLVGEVRPHVRIASRSVEGSRTAR